MKSCKICAFFSVTALPGSCDPDYEGFCVKNAPSSITELSPYPELLRTVSWPLVKATDWCGEFQIKPGGHPTTD